MNTAQLPRLPAPRPAQPPRQEPQRRFEIVTPEQQRRARPKVLHALVAVAGAAAIVGAQLLVSIWITGGQYRIAELQESERSLVRQAESLSEQLEIRSSTQYLGYAATSLGMQPARSLFTLDMATGSYYALPGTPDLLGCAGACGLAANELIKGLPLPQKVAAPTAPVDAVAANAAGAAGAAGAATPTADAATPTIPGGAPVEAPVDPDAPVVADTLPGVVTH